MANTKISALTSATTPLAGTEVLPIVQSGSNVKVANNDLRPKQIQSNATSGVLQVAGPAAAATRVMTTPDANFTVARTDAGQTFTGNQIVNGNILVNTTGITGSLNGDVINLFGSGTVRVISQTTGQYAVVNVGSGGTSATPTTTAFLFTDSTGNIAYFGTGTNTPLKINVNNSTAFTFDTSNNLVPANAAKGINFTANTGAAGKTSQLLNWYEEGTWTPSISNAFNNYTHTIQVGRYTRIGNLVTLEFTVAWTTTNAGALNFIVEGLPFTPVTLTNYASAGSIGVVNNLTNTNQIVCQIESATSQIKFYARVSGGAATALASANWNTAGTENKVSGTIAYQV